MYVHFRHASLTRIFISFFLFVHKFPTTYKSERYGIIFEFLRFMTRLISMHFPPILVDTRFRGSPAWSVRVPYYCITLLS